MLRSAEAFVCECRDRDYAESTIETHTSSLETFSEWVDTQGISVTECEAPEIEEFIQWVKRQKAVSYGDIRSATFWSLKKYFAYLVEEEEMYQNPCDSVDIVDCIILDDVLDISSGQERRKPKGQSRIENLASSSSRSGSRIRMKSVLRNSPLSDSKTTRYI